MTVSPRVFSLHLTLNQCRNRFVLYGLNYTEPLRSLLLTSVWTIAGRCVLSVLTVWKTSTTPSYCIRSSTMLREMNTPVRPTPALKKRGFFSYLRFFEDFLLLLKVLGIFCVYF